MGRAAYKSTKEGSGHSFECFQFNHKGRPCHVYSDSMPSKQIIGQTITHTCYMCSCKHVGVAEVIAVVLQRFSYTHILCHTEVWGAEIGPVAAGPAGHAPTALDTMQKLSR